MTKKKIESETIDEKFILDSIVKDRKEKAEASFGKDNTIKNEPQRQEEKPPKEEKRKRRSNHQNYEELFIREAESNTSKGKHVYIRNEFHNKISRIIHVIANNEMSIYSYIDNVLAHHFETFQDEITDSYNQKHSNLF